MVHSGECLCHDSDPGSEVGKNVSSQSQSNLLLKRQCQRNPTVTEGSTSCRHLSQPTDQERDGDSEWQVANKRDLIVHLVPFSPRLVREESLKCVIHDVSNHDLQLTRTGCICQLFQHGEKSTVFLYHKHLPRIPLKNEPRQVTWSWSYLDHKSTFLDLRV